MAEPENNNIDLKDDSKIEEPKRGFNAYDPSTPDVYANNLETIIGPAEISLVFGHNIEPSGLASQPVVRVTMTHYHFLLIMQYLNRRVEALDKLYAGRLVTLEHIAFNEPDKTKLVFEELFNKDP